MAQYQPSPQQMDQRLLLQLLLYMAAQQQQGPQQRPGNQTSDVQQFLDYIKKAKSTYDDAKTLYNAGSSAYSYLFPTYNAATQAAWNAGAGEAAQAAWNAGANTAWNSGEAANAAWNAGADAATPGLTEGGSLTSAGNVLGGLGGAYMAYTGANQVLNANKVGGAKGRVGGLMGGGTAGLGAGLAVNALGLALGPVGWAALLGGALLGGGLAGWRIGDKDMYKTEGKRLGKLLKQGVDIPEWLQGPRWLKKGRSKQDLINPYLPKDFIGKDPKYGWTNNKFAESRNVADLRPEDIWGYSAFFDRYGNDWLKKFSEQQRRDIAQSALNRGAVREHHGTIDIDWTPELQGDTSRVLGPNYKIPVVTPQANQPAPPQQNRPQEPLKIDWDKIVNYPGPLNRPQEPLPINGNMDPFNKNTNPSPQLPPPGQYTRVSPGVYLDSNGRTVLQHQRKLK